MKRVDVLVDEWIPGDGVDCEITTPRRFGRCEVRVAGNRERSVPAADPRFGARQGDVDVLDLVDREALADGVHRADLVEQSLHALRRQAEDFDVDVLVGPTEQLVPHPAADDERATAGCPYTFSDQPGRCKTHLTTLNP